MRRTTPAAGFTLIELMLALGIVALLAAIALPAYRHYIYAAKASELLTRIDALRETATEYSTTHGWPARLENPPPLNLWPDPIDLPSGNLSLPHLQAIVKTASDGRPVAIFHGTDPQGPYIIDEAMTRLPKALIYNHQPGVLLAVYLLDNAPTQAAQAVGGGAQRPVMVAPPQPTITQAPTAPALKPQPLAPPMLTQKVPTPTQPAVTAGPVSVSAVTRHPATIPSACYGHNGILHYYNQGHFSMCPKRSDVINGVWYP